MSPLLANQHKRVKRVVSPPLQQMLEQVHTHAPNAVSAHHAGRGSAHSLSALPPDAGVAGAADRKPSIAAHAIDVRASSLEKKTRAGNLVDEFNKLSTNQQHKASVDETTEEEKNYRQMMRTNDVGPGSESNGSLATAVTPTALEVRADKLAHADTRVAVAPREGKNVFPVDNLSRDASKVDSKSEVKHQRKLSSRSTGRGPSKRQRK